MQYVQLGRSGAKVSRIVLGTMNFGPQTSEEDSHAIMDAAVDKGVNFFDTANVYGGVEHRGWTEEIVGRWLQKSGKRDEIVLATKVYGEMTKIPNQSKLSALNIRRACDESLRRLQTDHIDLYQMHHIDRMTPWEEIWQAMDLLIAQGKISYVGSSNFAGWHIAAACDAAVARHTLGLVSEQSLYNLTARTVELEVLPAARHYGLGVIPWSPVAGGLLGGVLKKAKEGRRAAEGVTKRIAELKPQLTKWEKLCAELGEEPGDVALAWTLAQEGVTGPIIGPRTMAQLDGAVHALDIKLTKDTMAMLDEIFPGPGGAAPEAYAW
ncbi:MAG TPA: aldo/keto reductase [Propionibacteriaceae bacterium]|nr:aldo/keto reductase [Propionibacteriaceae bacterium]HQE30853.1 aldo/keto reductase [Propionibacteriaceae bacterium]